jgi:hypothetical protein
MKSSTTVVGVFLPVLNMGLESETWVPVSGDSYPEMGGVCDGPVCSPRAGCMSQLLSRAFTAPPCPGEVTMSKRASTRVAARVASKRAFARVHPDLGLVAHSPEVLGMAQCLDSRSRMPRAYGAYCFKLSFTPVAVIANAIAHPDDDEFGPILYTAGPNVTGQFTKDKYGHGVECPAGFQDAAVVGRYGGGDGLVVRMGGFFVMFFG